MRTHAVVRPAGFQRMAMVFGLCAFGLNACGGSGDAVVSGPVTTVSASMPKDLSVLVGNTGSRGNIDGLGTQARFYSPTGIARDLAGNLYVADRGNATLRKITAAGAVTTLAGLAGSLGVSDGVGNLARFTSPAGVTVDSAGNVYVTDGSMIRKITATGVVSTLMTSTALGGSLSGITVDAQNNLYVVADTTVRKLDPAGTVTTVADFTSTDPYPGCTVQLMSYSMAGIALDRVGNVYFAAPCASSIYKVTVDGVMAKVAGLYAGSLTSDAQGNVYVATTDTVRKIDLSGMVTVLGGTLTGTPAVGLAVDNAGAAFVTGGVNWSSIVKLNAEGSVDFLAGDTHIYPNKSVDGSAQVARFVSPTGIALDTAGNAYVLDDGNLRQVTPQGVVSTLKAGLVGFYSDGGIAMDGAGNVYVADRIYKESLAGSLGFGTLQGGSVSKFVPATGTVTKLWSSAVVTPSGITADASGNIYISDSNSLAVVKIAPSGAELGQLPTTVSSFPSGTVYRSVLVIDAAGNTLIAAKNAIVKISPTGVITTLAGSVNVPGYADGIGATARFGDIKGLAIDTVGNLYVADTSSHTVRKITSAGLVSTVLGKQGSVGIGLGNVPGSLYAPMGLAFDSNGFLYIISATSVLKARLP